MRYHCGIDRLFKQRHGSGKALQGALALEWKKEGWRWSPHSTEASLKEYKPRVRKKTWLGWNVDAVLTEAGRGGKTARGGRYEVDVSQGTNPKQIWKLSIISVSHTVKITTMMLHYSLAPGGLRVCRAEGHANILCRRLGSVPSVWRSRCVISSFLSNHRAST